MFALKSLDATLFLVPAGQILFDSILRDEINLLAIILTAIGLVYMFLPVSDIISYFNKEKFFIE